MANVQRQYGRLSRRTFLRGAGAALALPLLECMTPNSARADEAVAARRCAFIYFPNGCNIQQWFPKSDGAKFEFSPTLKPLETLRKDLSVISGLHHPNAYNGHAVADNWLTAAKLDGTPGYTFKNSLSIDQLLAEKIGAATRYSSLELSTIGGTGSQNNASTLAWNSNGVPLPAESRPSAIYEKLFVEDAGGAAQIKKRNDQTSALLDTVLDSATSLRGRLGEADKHKLAEYLESVREVEKEVERADKWLRIPKPKIAGDVFRKSIPQGEVKAYLRTMYDLMFLAFQNDSTRVITYLSHRETAGFAVPEIGVPQDQHSLTHHNNDADRLAKLATIDRFLVEQFAYFLGRLKDTKEGERSLLDSTLVLYGSGSSNTHQHFHLPIVLAGGGGLGFKHGQHLDLSKQGVVQQTHNERTSEGVNWVMPINKNARMSNLFLTLARGVGVNADKFQDSTGLISELLPA